MNNDFPLMSFLISEVVDHVSSIKDLSADIKGSRRKKSSAIAWIGIYVANVRGIGMLEACRSLRIPGKIPVRSPGIQAVAENTVYNEIVCNRCPCYSKENLSSLVFGLAVVVIKRSKQPTVFEYFNVQSARELTATFVGVLVWSAR
jgi:hypothetical protein